MNQRPHLRHRAGFGRGFSDDAGFLHVVRQRLLAVDVLAGLQCRQSCVGVRVLARADDHGIDIPHVFIQLAEIGITTSFRKRLALQVEALRIHITQCDHVDVGIACDRADV